MFESAQSPLSFSGLLSKIFECYKEIFMKVLPLVVLISLVGFLGAVVMGGKSPLSAWGLIQALIDVAVFAFLYIGILHLANEAMHNREETLGNAIQVALVKFLPVLAATVMTYIAMSIGLILLVIPGIIVIILLAFWQPLIVLDNEKVFDAAKHSVKLVWGKWWFTFGIFILIGLIPAVLGFLFAPTPGAATNFLGAVINLLINIAFMPLLVSAVLVLLTDLKLREAGKTEEVKEEAQIENKPENSEKSDS